MAIFKFRLADRNRRELFILYVIAVVSIIEFLGLMVMVYLAKIPAFISVFVKTLKILSPIFIGINVVFLIFTVFVKKRKSIVQSWKNYVRELIRFSVLSFAITIALVIISTLLGILIELTLRHIFNLSEAESVIEHMREWISRNFY